MISDKDLPYYVFIDTQVYRALSFEWGHPLIESLRERVERGSIQLITTDVCLQEIRAQLHEMSTAFDQSVQRAAWLATFLSPLGDPRVSALLQLAQNRVQAEIPWQHAQRFLDAMSCTLLAAPDDAFDKIFKLYFSGSPPFGVKNKKNEFPDAANMVLLLKSCASDRKSYLYCFRGWRLGTRLQNP